MGRARTIGEYIQLTDGGAADATRGIHPESLYSIVNVATDSTTVCSSPAVLFGVYVNTALSAHTLLIQDQTTASLSVSAATSANPIQITTSTPHGLATGWTASFASMPGDFGTNLNGNSYTITYVNTTAFTINVNGVGYAAYTTGGTVVGSMVVVTIPASAPAGSMYPLPGFVFSTSLVVNPNDAATGSVALAYRPL